MNPWKPWPTGHEGCTPYQESFNCTFAFLPGAALAIKPDNLQLSPSIFLPLIKRIVWHDINSPLSDNSVK
jgi:hypothetical protein